MSHEATIKNMKAKNKYRKLLYSSSFSRDKLVWILYETVVLGIFVDILFWISVFGYFFTKYLTQDVKVPAMPSSLPSACTNFIAFLLVFYMTACYGRFREQHDAVMKSIGSLNSICLFAHNCFSVAGSRRIYRHLNAAHILSFVGLDGIYQEKNLFVPLNDTHKILTQNEIEKLKDFSFQGSTPFRVLLSWVMESIRYESEQGKTSKEEMVACFQLVLDLRASLSRIYHFKQQPVPYSYVVLVTTMVDWFLPFYAVSIGYTSAGTVSNEGFFGFFLEFLYVITYVLITTGLRRLGARLQDPMGMDLEDFDVLEIVSNGLDQTNKILSAPRVSLTSENEELAFVRNVPSKQQQSADVSDLEVGHGGRQINESERTNGRKDFI